VNRPRSLDRRDAHSLPSEQRRMKIFPSGNLIMELVAPAFRFLTILVLAGLSFAQSVEQRSTGSPEGIAFFEKNVRPLLASRCYGCHNSAQLKPMGGLVLDSRAGMLRGGQSGVPSIVPGKPEESLLVKAVRGTNENLSPTFAVGPI